MGLVGLFFGLIIAIVYSHIVYEINCWLVWCYPVIGGGVFKWTDPRVAGKINVSKGADHFFGGSER